MFYYLLLKNTQAFTRITKTIVYLTIRTENLFKTVLGDSNPLGLRGHAPIKIRKRRPNPFMFNMNY